MNRRWRERGRERGYVWCGVGIVGSGILRFLNITFKRDSRQKIIVYIICLPMCSASEDFTNKFPAKRLSAWNKHVVARTTNANNARNFLGWPYRTPKISDGTFSTCTAHNKVSTRALISYHQLHTSAITTTLSQRWTKRHSRCCSFEQSRYAPCCLNVPCDPTQTC